MGAAVKNADGGVGNARGHPGGGLRAVEGAGAGEKQGGRHVDARQAGTVVPAVAGFPVNAVGPAVLLRRGRHQPVKELLLSGGPGPLPGAQRELPALVKVPALVRRVGEHGLLREKGGKGLVVVVNKWDLVEDKSKEAIRHYEEAIRARFAPFTDFPIIFASAITKQRIFKVLETALEVCKNRQRIIPTSQLNTVMLEAISAYPPPANKGKFVRIKYVTMLKGAQIPTFIFFCNLPQWVKEPYRRYLENKIRENWDFHGTPINIFMREK